MTAAAMPTRQAVILVGGRGTRLGALAAHIPKPLMPITRSFVFLDYLLCHMARQGFDDILLLAGHLSAPIIARYDQRTVAGAKLRVMSEPEPSGTAGALTHVRDFLHETFLLANGDTVFDIDLRLLDAKLQAHPEAMAVLAMRHVPDAGRYGHIVMEGDFIRAFCEKTPEASGARGLINAGIGLFRRTLVDRIERLPCSIETDIYPQLAAQGLLRGMEFSAYFIDIGLPETWRQACKDLWKLFPDHDMAKIFAT